MNIADRALQAYEATEEAKEAARAAERARVRAEVIEEISRKAEIFGIDFDPSGLKDDGIMRLTFSTPVDDDATLVFTYSKFDGLVVNVKPSDQIYWDLPLGQEVKGPGGGSYGCYNLGGGMKVSTLAELGAQIKRTREARELWRKKHCLKSPSGRGRRRSAP